MGTDFILSICIPTYNMGNKVSKTIDCLLQCPDTRFNIIVLDNCSTDNSYSHIVQKTSNRVVVKQNIRNLGASLNYIGALRLSESKFCMTLLDKDFINISMLPEFINFLVNEDEIFGYCELNYKEGESHGVKRWKKGIESVMNTAYLSKHPTGYFYNTKILKDSLNESYYEQMDPTIPFPYEIINAHLGIHYDSCKVLLPLCYPEPRNHNTTKSMSYSEDNLFYAPKRRNIEYSAYLNDVFSLDLERWQINRLTSMLYRRFLDMVSIGYKNCMSDDFLCNHYNVTKRKVSIIEQLHYSRIISETTKSILKKYNSPLRTLFLVEKMYMINVLRILKFSFI